MYYTVIKQDGHLRTRGKCRKHEPQAQPRSQGLSSLPSLVVGRKTLVAAGCVTTQNLGGKKICWVGGVAECFVWLMLQTFAEENYCSCESTFKE